MSIGFFERLEAQGVLIRMTPVGRVDELRKSIEAQRLYGLIDRKVYEEYLKSFNFVPPPDAMSVIVAAVGHPQTRFVFDHRGRKTPVFVPPTYLHAAKVDGRVQATIAKALAPYKVEPAVLPKKLLAVRSGLAAYGRNNISYVDGLGSFHRLSAFYTDLPCDDDAWREPVVLEGCRDCAICQDQCSAGAISKERFMLRAERCIVFHNEKPGKVPFPAWMGTSWHNCLVGCMRCQLFCPENKGKLQTMAGADFSREETELLLAGTPVEKLPPALIKKLEDSDLLSSLDVIPRNLGILLG